MSGLSILGVILLAVLALAFLSGLFIILQEELRDEPNDWTLSISIAAVGLYFAVTILWAFGIPFPQF